MRFQDAENRLWEALERPPEKLKDFELWLLHRAHRPDDFEDAELCAKAWHLTKTYRASLDAKGGD